MYPIDRLCQKGQVTFKQSIEKSKEPKREPGLCGRGKDKGCMLFLILTKTHPVTWGKKTFQEEICRKLKFPT